MNWRRAASWSAGALIVAIVAGALAFHALVDPERLKRKAREKAAQAWSRDLAIGEMSLQFLPMPSLVAKDVALANPAWARNRKLFQVESVTARLELLPLLVGHAQIKSLDLDGVKVSLEVGADGTASWALQPAPAAGKAKPPSEGELLNLETLHIGNADIFYRTKVGPAVIWRIEEATAEADAGLRNVRIDARIARRQRPLQIKAEIEDLSRIGKAGATSDGKVDLDWGQTQLAFAGRLPMGPGFKGHLMNADLKSAGLKDMLDFFDVKRGRTAPATAHVEMRESQGWTEVTKLAATLGKHKAAGDARISLSGAKPIVKARIESERIDWVRLLLDAGEPPAPELEPPEMFRDIPLAWPLLVSLQGSEGTIELKLGSLLLRNGVELRNARASAAFDGDRLNVASFATEGLGGSASGSMAFEGRRKVARVNFDGNGLLLERWFRERGAKIPFTGGPMKVKANFTATGDSMRDLAATITGPISIRIGPAVWASEKAGHAESVMVSAFSPKDSGSIQFECIGAMLPFKSGRASAKTLIGARSTATQLLTSGFVDLRDESLDLRGRVQPRSGKVGLATVAGDIMIAGKIRAPHASLDPVSTPGMIARAGAAIATAGLSLVGTAMADAANTKKNDPCEAVFSTP